MRRSGKERRRGIARRQASLSTRPMAVALLAAAAGGPVGAQAVTYNGSLQYSTGSYIFAERTHSVYLVSGVTLASDRVQLSGSVPLILQNSALVTYVAGGPLPTGGPDHEAVRRREPGSTIPTHRGGRGGWGGGRGSMDRSGALLPAGATAGAAQAADSVEFADEFGAHLGDPYLYASLDAFSGFGVVRSLRLSGGAKMPVADLDSGVGTGEWDYSAGASLMLGLGRLYLFGDVAWWWLGDLPGLELRDGPSYGLGAGRAISDGGSILVTLSGARSVLATARAPLTAGLSLGYTLREGRSVNGGIGVGLSESSPDFSVFVGWSLDL